MGGDGNHYVTPCWPLQWIGIFAIKCCRVVNIFNEYVAVRRRSSDHASRDAWREPMTASDDATSLIRQRSSSSSSQTRQSNNQVAVAGHASLVTVTSSCVDDVMAPLLLIRLFFTCLTVSGMFSSVLLGNKSGDGLTGRICVLNSDSWAWHETWNEKRRTKNVPVIISALTNGHLCSSMKSHQQDHFKFNYIKNVGERGIISIDVTVFRAFDELCWLASGNRWLCVIVMCSVYCYVKKLFYSHSTPKLWNTVHCVSKNAPTLTSCSFDKHGLILIIFG